MNNFILFDDSRSDLLPLTFTRPVADLRIGILTIGEKWEKLLKSTISFLTEDYLAEKYPTRIGNENIFINGSIIPNSSLVKSIVSLKEGQHLVKANILVAVRLNRSKANSFSNNISEAKNIVQYNGELFKISFPWDIFRYNGQAFEADFKLITSKRKSALVSKTNRVAGKGNIFIEKGAKVECSILNASAGSIYIGKDAEIMEGCLIRGPFALCDHSTLKMGAKIYGPTTVGPNSKVGGEVNNSVIQANTNKAHEGFLGNSVIGEWCNIGADSNNSNLKNNYAEVKMWNFTSEKFMPTGLQFCGLIMGDHSKCGINTMFNTGTVVGISANIFGSGFPRNFIPSFSWGGPQGVSVYSLEKAFETVGKVFQRRGLEFTTMEKKILEHIFLSTEKNLRF
jgi:UDP-N-acetylglucosamine diphosphorylase/glucosamine-1-phosphate N-acetyltransferase